MLWISKNIHVVQFKRVDFQANRIADRFSLLHYTLSSTQTIEHRIEEHTRDFVAERVSFSERFAQWRPRKIRRLNMEKINNIQEWRADPCRHLTRPGCGDLVTIKEKHGEASDIGDTLKGRVGLDLTFAPERQEAGGEDLAIMRRLPRECTRRLLLLFRA